MKNIAKYIVITALSLLALFACKKQEAIKPVFVVTPESGTLTIPADGEQQPIGVMANVAWTATASEDWIILDRTSGTDSRPVQVSASENIAEAGKIAPARTGTVTISGNGQDVVISVTQEAEAAQFTVTPSTTEQFDAEGGSLSISVLYNIASYSYSIPTDATWIKDMSTKGSLSEIISLQILSNEGDARSATITFTPSQGSPCTVTVSQAGISSPEPGPVAEPVQCKFMGADMSAGFGVPFTISDISWTVLWEGDDIFAEGKVTDNDSFDCKQFGSENYVIKKLTLKASGYSAKVGSITICVAKSGSASNPYIDHISIGGTALTAPAEVELQKKTPADMVYTAPAGGLSGDLEIVIVSDNATDGGKAGIRLSYVTFTPAQ